MNQKQHLEKINQNLPQNPLVAFYETSQFADIRRRPHTFRHDEHNLDGNDMYTTLEFPCILPFERHSYVSQDCTRLCLDTRLWHHEIRQHKNSENRRQS